jgi:hypothetical protein
MDMQFDSLEGNHRIPSHAIQDLPLMDSSNFVRFLDIRKIPRVIFLAGLIIGSAFFWYYYAHGLTLAHYDAKAHLLVARRIVDSLEPGYAQMGSHWLPLLHLLYLPFILFETQYRSGFLPSLISVFAFALSGALVYRISHRVTGSVAAGVCAAVVLFSNPNLEYLQSCPLTEPVFMALFLLAMDRLILWRESDHSTLPWLAAFWSALAGLCRYEGWYFLFGVILLLTYDAWTHFIPRRRAFAAGATFLGLFGALAAAHFGYIFLRLGSTFFQKVAEGNPDPYMTYKRPILSFVFHLAELSQMAAILPLLLAAAGLTLFLCQREKIRSRMPLVLLWVPSLINISALYWGLIYRLRYSVLLLPAVAIFASLGIPSDIVKKRALIFLLLVILVLPWISWFSFLGYSPHMFAPGPGAWILPVMGLILFFVAQIRPRYNWPLLLLCVIGMQLPPLAREDRPIMTETLEHEFIEPERQEILRYLRQNYDDSRVLIDMGRQAPLIYDSGLPVKEFVYNEGGAVFWHKAMRNPEQQAGWIFAEKGDAIWQRIQEDSRIPDKYALAVETENFSLYRLK